MTRSFVQVVRGQPRRDTRWRVRLAVELLEARWLPSSIRGKVWFDFNNNGAFDTGEGLANRVVYTDWNYNGQRDTGEFGVTTSAAGDYVITFSDGVSPARFLVAVDGFPYPGNPQNVVTSPPQITTTISNAGFEDAPDLNNWPATGNRGTRRADYGIPPTEGQKQAWVKTGTGSTSRVPLESFLGLPAGSLNNLNNGVVTQGSAVKTTTFTAPAGAVVSFDWNFLTGEYYPPYPYNDFGFAALVPGQLVTLARNDGSGAFNQAPPQTGFSRQTGYRYYAFTVPASGTYTLGLGAADVVDTVVESGLVADRVRLWGGVHAAYLQPGENLTGRDFRGSPAPCTVTTTADSGPGSLRECITFANSSPRLNSITFNIPGTGVKTINLVSSLPTIMAPVVIDGYTQPGARANTLPVGNNAVLLIELNGAGAGAGSNCLTLHGGNSVVKGLVLNRCRGHGIELRSSGFNVIEGNFIGTSPDGTRDLGNALSGVYVVAAGINTIGGLTPQARNLLSGNDGHGIHLAGSATPNNLVQGNYIGTNAAGTLDLGNAQSGVFIEETPNNTIGGTSPAARNVISGNDNYGVAIRGAGARNNRVQGNYLGTNAAGSAALGNTWHGVKFLNGPSGNLVGGVVLGARNIISGNESGIDIDRANDNTIQGNYIGTDAGGTTRIANQTFGVGMFNGASGNTVGGLVLEARNVISGNQQDGVRIEGIGAMGNRVQGNYIGLNRDGNAAMGNSQYGVNIVGAPNTLIGGTDHDPGVCNRACNVISGNGTGVRTQVSMSLNTRIQGNYIGTDPSGTSAIPNADSGVHLGALSDTVGGGETGAGNLISGNGSVGVYLTYAQSARVQGNLIGTDASGDHPLRNTLDGVYIIFSSGNTIGGTSAAERNVISGNGRKGILIDRSTGTHVLGNYIGTNRIGTAPVGNEDGVWIANTPDNFIGGTVAGSRNLISGNRGHGISISGTAATGNVVRGNYIGTTADGTAPLITHDHGVNIFNAPNNLIGGDTPAARNVISGSRCHGVQIEGAGATNNRVQGNYIGTNAAGMASLGNSCSGVIIRNAPGNSVGDAAAGTGNLISGNAAVGVALEGAGATNNRVQGNSIGTNAASTAALPNQWSGVLVTNAPNNTIGGTVAAARNVLSGNRQYGILIEGSNASGNVVQGNYIGINAAGTAALPNTLDGVSLLNATNNTVGGTDHTPGLCDRACNVISGNGRDGVLIQGTAATGNRVEGNYIGTNPAGVAALANTRLGVYLLGAPGNFIGGTSTMARNVISGNREAGVYVEGPQASGNRIEGNYIGSNAAGTAALPNVLNGVWIVEAPRNFVGGPATGAGNLISGNGGAGVMIYGENATGNVVQGNRIGTDFNGIDRLMGNLQGGVVITDASNNLIGGTAAGAGNRIAYNVRDGVTVVGGVDNTIRANSIFSNADLGIDIGDDGVTFHNVSWLYAAWSFPGFGTLILGFVYGTPFTPFTLEFFANSDADPSFFGEGEVPLRTDTAATNDVGLGFFQAYFQDLVVPAGYCLSATATELPVGTTWEFGNCLVVEGGSGPGSGSTPGGGFDGCTLREWAGATAAVPSTVVEALAQRSAHGSMAIPLHGRAVEAAVLGMTASRANLRLPDAGLRFDLLDPFAAEWVEAAR